MAHSIDTQTNSTRSNGDDKTFSHTCGSGTTVLVLLIAIDGGTDREAVAPTYNGVDMVQADAVRKAAVTPETTIEMWYKLAPPTGAAYNIVIPNSGGVYITARTISFKASPGSKTALREASSTTNTSTDPTGPTHSNIVLGDLIIALCGHGNDVSAGTASETSLYGTDDGTYSHSGQYRICLGEESRSLNWVQANSDDWVIISAVFKELGIIGTNTVGVSKSVAYAVITESDGLHIAKAIAYAVVSPPAGVSISKAVAYAVIAPPAEVPPEPPPENNFENNADCVALWRFEAGALVVDSRSTNTLTDNNTVGQETAAPLEGSGSALLRSAQSEYLSISDTNLVSGFPLKSGGTGTGTFSIFWRFKFNTQGTFFSKTADGKRTVGVEIDQNSKLSFWIGTGTNNFEVVGPHASVLTTGVHYCAAVSFDNVSKEGCIRLRTTDGDVIGSDYSEITSNNISIYDASFEIGRSGDSGYYDGIIDETVIFKGILTSEEVTSMARRTYASNEPPIAAEIFFEIKSVDFFNQESGSTAINAMSGSLQIASTDVATFAIDASKMFTKIPVIEGLTLSANSPAPGRISWLACTLYYNGVAYAIAAGNTILSTHKFVYWKDLDSVFMTSIGHPADTLSNWKPGEDYIIAMNIGGNPQEAWNGIANEVIGSAYIMNAAINDAHIVSLSGVKIQSSSSVSIGMSSTYGALGTQLQYNGGAPRFHVGNKNAGGNYLEFDGINVNLKGKLSAGMVGLSDLGETIIEGGYIKTDIVEAGSLIFDKISGSDGEKLSPHATAADATEYVGPNTITTGSHLTGGPDDLVIIVASFIYDIGSDNIGSGIIYRGVNGTYTEVANLITQISGHPFITFFDGPLGLDAGDDLSYRLTYYAIGDQSQNYVTVSDAYISWAMFRR